MWPKVNRETLSSWVCRPRYPSRLSAARRQASAANITKIEKSTSGEILILRPAGIHKAIPLHCPACRYPAYLQEMDAAMATYEPEMAKGDPQAREIVKELRSFVLSKLNHRGRQIKDMVLAPCSAHTFMAAFARYGWPRPLTQASATKYKITVTDVK